MTPRARYILIGGIDPAAVERDRRSGAKVLHEPIGPRRGGGQLRSTCRLNVGHSGLGLPLISADGVPLGLKIAGFAGERAGLFV
jgi:hypothetical protein